MGSFYKTESPNNLLKAHEKGFVDETAHQVVDEGKGSTQCRLPAKNNGWRISKPTINSEGATPQGSARNPVISLLNHGRDPWLGWEWRQPYPVDSLCFRKLPL